LSGPTVEALAQALEGVAPPRGSLVLLNEGRAAAPLFLVPGASGNPMSYLPLARDFGDERPVYGFTLPGHSDPAQTFASIQQLAGLYAQVVRASWPDGPYLLAGHSFGGAVAFEMARVLADADARVGLVAIVDLPRPRRVDGMEEAIRARDDATWIADIAGAIGAFLGKPIALDVEALRRLDAADRSRALLEHLVDARIVPPDARPTLVPALVEAYRASAAALAAYEAEPLNVPIVLLRPSEGPTRDDGDPATDRTLGWEAATSHPVRVHRLPGSHITMIKEPHVQALARALRESVAAAEA
jgi:thioesterase domain-containing protein